MLWRSLNYLVLHPFPPLRMKTILSSQTVDVPDNGKWEFYCRPPNQDWTRFVRMGLIQLCVPVCPHSRGEVEGADSDCQGTPWKTREGVQPHQPGAQPPGQETEKGMKSLSCPVKTACTFRCVLWSKLEQIILQKQKCTMWTDAEVVRSQCVHFMEMFQMQILISDNCWSGRNF